MRAYVATNGTIFSLIVLAHIARIAAEGLGPVREPIFVLSSLLSIGMLAWSIVMYRRITRGVATDSGANV